MRFTLTKQRILIEKYILNEAEVVGSTKHEYISKTLEACTTALEKIQAYNENSESNIDTTELALITKEAESLQDSDLTKAAAKVNQFKDRLIALLMQPGVKDTQTATQITATLNDILGIKDIANAKQASVGIDKLEKFKGLLQDLPNVLNTIVAETGDLNALSTAIDEASTSLELLIDEIEANKKLLIDDEPITKIYEAVNKYQGDDSSVYQNATQIGTDTQTIMDSTKKLDEFYANDMDAKEEERAAKEEADNSQYTPENLESMLKESTDNSERKHILIKAYNVLKKDINNLADFWPLLFKYDTDWNAADIADAVKKLRSTIQIEIANFDLTGRANPFHTFITNNKNLINSLTLSQYGIIHNLYVDKEITEVNLTDKTDTLASELLTNITLYRFSESEVKKIVKNYKAYLTKLATSDDKEALRKKAKTVFFAVDGKNVLDADTMAKNYEVAFGEKAAEADEKEAWNLEKLSGDFKGKSNASRALMLIGYIISNIFDGNDVVKYCTQYLNGTTNASDVKMTPTDITACAKEFNKFNIDKKNAKAICDSIAENTGLTISNK